MDCPAAIPDHAAISRAKKRKLARGGRRLDCRRGGPEPKGQAGRGRQESERRRPRAAPRDRESRLLGNAREFEPVRRKGANRVDALFPVGVEALVDRTGESRGEGPKSWGWVRSFRDDGMPACLLLLLLWHGGVFAWQGATTERQDDEES